MTPDDQLIFNNIAHHPISWWADRLTRPWSLARFGDGELCCLEARAGKNSHGCHYTPELRADLQAAWDNPHITKGMLRVLPKQYRRHRASMTGEWIDAEVMYEALAAGELAPVFRVLRQKPLVIISSAEKRSIPLPFVQFIEVPHENAHTDRARVIDEILRIGEPHTYLFSCGMAAGAFVNVLHGRIPGASFIDFGHVWDPFLGNDSRYYLHGVDRETLRRCLEPST